MSKKSAPHARKRTAAVLSSRVEKRLIAYVAVASAAGVGALASPSAAEAKVVYAPTWIPIMPYSNQQVILDLNNDGVGDFQLSSHEGTYSSMAGKAILNVIPLNATNGVVGTNSSASALQPGVTVGSQAKFKVGKLLMARRYWYFRQTESSQRIVYRYSSQGKWPQTTRLFLGVKFVIQGQVNYGWVRMNVTATTRGINAAVNGYAYETTPNTPILTGQTSGGLKTNSDGRKTLPGPSNSMPAGLGRLAVGSGAAEPRH